MSVSIYEMSIPVLTLGLTNLAGLLDKGTTHAENRKFDANVLTHARLFPDMLPFTRQVLIACDMAKGCAARLAGVENPKFEDTETTMPELKARIAKTKAFLASVQPAQFNDAEMREIVLTFPGYSLKFNGFTYVTRFVLPNFYFHTSMVYALLRHNGIEIGKGDFLGAIQ